MKVWRRRRGRGYQCKLGDEGMRERGRSGGGRREKMCEPEKEEKMDV